MPPPLAGLVFHDHGLLQGHLQLLRQGAAHHVGRTARGERHDVGNGLGLRPLGRLRKDAAGQRRRHSKKGEGDAGVHLKCLRVDGARAAGSAAQASAVKH